MSPLEIVILAGLCGGAMVACFVIAICKVSAEANREQVELADAFLDEREIRTQDLRPLASGVDVQKRTGAARTARPMTRR